MEGFFYESLMIEDLKQKISMTTPPMVDQVQQKAWLQNILLPSVEEELKCVALWRVRWESISQACESTGNVIQVIY
jgi:uncharacterized protein YqcC (DUF446 family)